MSQASCALVLYVVPTWRLKCNWVAAMALYHFSAKVISRSTGASALASAAYRSASRLRDERLDRSHDFTNKSGVVHSEIMLPDGAPEHLSDRERLWNEVEAGERRKDAQLAREVEFAIPREMNREQGIELARDFVRTEFVSRGMVADVNVHRDLAADGSPKPHAHVMLTMREVNERGFGAKERDWNRTALIERWREAWADHVNERLAELGIDARVDHRSLEAQGIALEPQHKIGPAAGRMATQGLCAERLDEHLEIARENGERILAQPTIAIEAITQGQATFTRRDLAKFVHRHSADREQFDRVQGVVLGAPELVTLGRDGHGEERFTSRAMIEAETRLARATEELAVREQHRVSERHRENALARSQRRGLTLSAEQRTAFEHVTSGRDLSVVLGYAGTGKSAMLGVAREAWERDGYSVRGLALSGIAAENLEGGSGIASRTIASLEHQWEQGRGALTGRDVLVIDEAGMIGTREMERVLSRAERHGTKVVLVGDIEQLQAIEAGAALRSIAERVPHVEITGIRRQQEEWQREATRKLATERTAEALEAYDSRGHVHAAENREQARASLIERWDSERASEPAATRIILTHTNDEVHALNLAARDRLRAAGELGQEVPVEVERGERSFAPGDRIMFLKNDRGLGIKNGTLGTLETVSDRSLTVRLDGGRDVALELTDYAHLDHGYAATIHKAQGVTVGRTHVLATPGMDRHSAYVALSRHRESVQLHYGRDDFDSGERLARMLSRERAKDMASDYAREPGREEKQPKPEPRRNIFASFRPTGPVPAVERPMEPSRPTVGKAVERYARTVSDAQRMAERGLPVLPHQQTALSRAREALDALRPHAAHDLSQAFSRDPSVVGEAAAGRTRRALTAMQLGTEVRTNPALRADRFVRQWRALYSQRQQLVGDAGARNAVTGRMGDLAQSLRRDPQLDSLLRGKRNELGLPATGTDSVARQLTRQLGLGRGRELGIGM